MVYDLTILSPTPGSDTSFTLDSDARTITILSTDTNEHNLVYHLKVLASISSTEKAAFQYTITFRDPCIMATLTIDPAILSSLDLTYTLHMADLEEPLDKDAYITKSPAIPDGVTCPYINLWL